MRVTPLEALRQIANGEDGHPLVNGLQRCHWCYEFVTTDPHLPDCPWLAMPQIVKALEAAEKVTAHGWVLNNDNDETCVLCGAMQPLAWDEDDDPDLVHEADCPGESLVRALKGAPQ